MANVKLTGFLVYLLFGLYFINSALEFVSLPAFFENIDKWILLVGGLLILVGGINFIRAGKKLKY